MILLAVFLGGLAVLAVRQKQFHAEMTAGIAALAAFGAMTLSADSHAASYARSLTGPGPLVVTVTDAVPHDVILTNNTGGVVTFKEFTRSRPAFSVSGASTCKTTVPLAVGASCTVILNMAE